MRAPTTTDFCLLVISDHSKLHGQSVRGLLLRAPVIADQSLVITEMIRKEIVQAEKPAANEATGDKTPPAHIGSDSRNSIVAAYIRSVATAG